MTLNLVGVHLGDKSWDGMNIRIGLNRKHNYANVSFLKTAAAQPVFRTLIRAMILIGAESEALKCRLSRVAGPNPG